jgi:hypothetical protein
MWPILNEKQKRYFAAIEADIIGFGGISVISRITGFTRDTIVRGLEDLNDPMLEIDKIRISGGGRQKIESFDPTLIDDISLILEESNPAKGQKDQLYTTRSILSITSELQSLGHDVKIRKIGNLIRDLGYSLLARKKLYVGKQPKESIFHLDVKNKQKNSALKRSEASVHAKKMEMAKNLKEQEKRLVEKNRSSKK